MHQKFMKDTNNFWNTIRISKMHLQTHSIGEILESTNSNWSNLILLNKKSVWKDWIILVAEII